MQSIAALCRKVSCSCYTAQSEAGPPLTGIGGTSRLFGGDHLYEKPAITRIGSIADFTQGGDPDNLGDGVSFRGPFEEQPGTPSS